MSENIYKNKCARAKLQNNYKTLLRVVKEDVGNWSDVLVYCLLDKLILKLICRNV